MKRFTATEKWRDKWFRTLPPEYKLLWLYMLDECSNAGIWEVDFDLARFVLGVDIDEVTAKKIFNGRVMPLSEDKWHIPKFIVFQYGHLNPENNAHRPVIKTLTDLKILGGSKPLIRSSGGPQDKDKEKKKEKKEGDSKGGGWEKVGEMTKDEFAVIEYLNQKTKRSYRVPTKELSARVKESGVLPCKKVIDNMCSHWLGTDQEKFLDTTTLFRKNNFDRYLNKDPKISEKPRPGDRRDAEKQAKIDNLKLQGWKVWPTGEKGDPERFEYTSVENVDLYRPHQNQGAA